jgi:hypothetical protein
MHAFGGVADHWRKIGTGMAQQLNAFLLGYWVESRNYFGHQAVDIELGYLDFYATCFDTRQIQNIVYQR